MDSDWDWLSDWDGQREKVRLKIETLFLQETVSASLCITAAP